MNPQDGGQKTFVNLGNASDLKISADTSTVTALTQSETTPNVGVCPNVFLLKFILFPNIKKKYIQ